MTLFEVDEAANRVREEVDPSANIIFGSTFNEALQGSMRVSVVATGIDSRLPAGQTLSRGFRVEEEEQKTAEAEEQEDQYEEQAEAEEDFEDEVDEVATAANTRNFEYRSFDDSEEADFQEENQATDSLGYNSEEDEEFSVKSSGQKKVFVSPAPSYPSDYVGSDPLAKAPKKQPASASSGGLFKRMAKVARSLQGGEQESMASELSKSLKKEPVMAEAGGDDLMDIPAFLRRKA